MVTGVPVTDECVFGCVGGGGMCPSVLSITWERQAPTGPFCPQTVLWTRPAASSRCPRWDQRSRVISMLGQVTTSPARLRPRWVVAAVWGFCVRCALTDWTSDYRKWRPRGPVAAQAAAVWSSVRLSRMASWPGSEGTSVMSTPFWDPPAYLTGQTGRWDGGTLSRALNTMSLWLPDSSIPFQCTSKIWL